MSKKKGKWKYHAPKPKRPPQPIVQTKVILKDGDQDWGSCCMNCEATPTVHPTQLCGPCCFGEAETAGGNW